MHLKEIFIWSAGLSINLVTMKDTKTGSVNHAITNFSHTHDPLPRIAYYSKVIPLTLPDGPTSEYRDVSRHAPCRFKISLAAP